MCKHFQMVYFNHPLKTFHLFVKISSMFIGKIGTRQTDARDLVLYYKICFAHGCACVVCMSAKHGVRYPMTVLNK